ncbi:MAG: tRNA (adenosine(37)-N6)-threonylcarbamoyltransferase complex ATPase subunit type 1 TsaE, partial [Cyclobacteriaceae bacterium]
IKAIADRLKIIDTVASPTYSIVNEYHGVGGEVCYHFDFYRIENDEEAEDIGFFEYLDSGNYCFIEWPEKIERLLPDSFVTIRLDMAADGARRIEMRVYE